MATATLIHPVPEAPFCPLAAKRAALLQRQREVEQLRDPRTITALEWANIIKSGLQALHNSDIDSVTPDALKYGLHAPRRKHKADERSRLLATEVAGLMYPELAGGELAQIIKYGMSSSYPTFGPLSPVMRVSLRTVFKYNVPAREWDVQLQLLTSHRERHRRASPTNHRIARGKSSRRPRRSPKTE